MLGCSIIYTSLFDEIVMYHWAMKYYHALVCYRTTQVNTGGIKLTKFILVPIDYSLVYSYNL